MLSSEPGAREVPVGKTPVPAREGQQRGAARGSPDEKRGKFHSLMGRVLDLRRLRAAYEAVRSNRGEPGVDGVTVEAFGEQLEANLAALVVELRAKTYRPQPVRRVLIPKPDGGQRPLGIPAVRDRVVQQAVLQVLEPIFEAQFSPHSHGFRPGRSTFSALRELYSQVRGGHVHIVDVDIEKFFDEIPHEPLLDAVAERVADGSVLWLVRLFLEALIQDGYKLVRPRAGTPQGGVVSPLLANVYLARLERFREEVRRLTRRTAGKSLRAVVSRLDRYLRGWGEYFKRAEVAGLFDRYDRWITRRLRAFMAKRWRNGLWRRYPDQWFWFHLGLTRLYHLRRNFIRELAARRGAGNRPVERSAGNPHATFVRGTEASS